MMQWRSLWLAAQAAAVAILVPVGPDPAASPLPELASHPDLPPAVLASPGVALGGVAGTPPRRLRQATLHLPEGPQFRYAGYFAALWKGYYEDAGLAVHIHAPFDPISTSPPPPRTVASGAADFGVGAADILVERDRLPTGAGVEELVVLRSFFQLSPAVLFIRDSVAFRTLNDVAGRRVARHPGSALDIEFRAMLRAQGVDPDAVIYANPDSLNPASLNPASLNPASPAFDAIMGSTIGTPRILHLHGIDTISVQPRDYGVNFYGDSLFTSRRLVNEDQAMVDAFITATQQGWAYALRHPLEIARLLAESFPAADGSDDPMAFNQAQIRPVAELTGTPVIDLGHVNPARWERMNETLQRLDLVSRPLDASTFLYPEILQEAERHALLRRTVLMVGGTLAVLLLAAFAGAVVMRQILLRRATDLARSEQNFRLLVDNLRDHAILWLDPQGRVSNWNLGAERMTGYVAEDVVGRPLSVLYPPAEARTGTPDSEVTRARESGRVEIEGLRMRRDGSTFWAQVVLSAVRDAHGGLLGFTLLLRDASQRKAQEDRIRFQAALLNRVRSAVIAIDDRGRVVYMNAYAEALFLLPWRQAENRPLDSLGLLPAEVVSGVGAPERGEQEITARRTDGKTFPALVLDSVTISPGGKERSAVFVIHDLTERKRLEANLQHSSNLALLGRMSASLVHEISQPMNVIRLTAEGGLLRLAQTPLNIDDLAKRFHTVSEQAARLFDTIDFMQTFSRRDAGRVGGQAGPPFDVLDAVRKVGEMMAARFAAAGVDLDLDLSPDLPPENACLIRGRRRQFEKVLLNLLTNALQALEDQRGGQGGRRDGRRIVRVRVAPPTAGDTRLTLRVEDSGPGIPDDLRQQIFEPFFTTKPPGQGTGLGLAISLGIVQSMEGTMSVRTSLDLGGACFVLDLPAETGDASPPEPGQARTGTSAKAESGTTPPPLSPPVLPAPPPSAANGPLMHVLVVDDEDLARQEVADYLAHHGFRVCQAADGQEALEIVHHHNGDTPSAGPPIDAVVTDIFMPGGSGTDLIGLLVEDYPQLFTIVMTGQPLSDREELEELGSGADIVLRKPIAPEELAAHLRDLHHQAQDGDSAEE